MLLVACAIIAVGSRGAGAQTPDTLPSDTIRPIEIGGLVVRALGTPVLADVLPYAVTVRRPLRSVPTAGLSLDRVIQAVPGLQVQSRYNDALGDRIVMRGFGARTQFGIRGIYVAVDGIPATMPDGQTTLNHLDLDILDQAVALRGPAAAAYGNAAGGALLMQTIMPPEVRFRQKVTGVAGGGGLLRLHSTSGGTRAGLGWVASLSREERDGFRPHARANRYQLTGRVELPVLGGLLRVATHGVTYDANNPGSLTPEQYREQPNQAQAYNVTQRTGETGRHGQIGISWEGPVSGARLEGTAYGLVRTLENPIPPTIIVLDRLAGGLRLLLRSDSGGVSAITWAIGADAAIQGDDRRNFENVGGERGSLTLDQTERVGNLAAHGQLLIPLVASLDVLIAARYDRVTFSVDDDLITAGNPDDSGHRAMGAFSPTAGLRFDVADDASLFANISSAFETPTTTELANRPGGAGGFNPTLAPQRTVSYEVGGRVAPVQGLRLEATVYHARVRDALIPFEVASAPGRQYFRNTARAIHRGVELLAELRTSRLDLLAAYSRIDASFADYATADARYDGNKVPGVRPWTVEAQATARPRGGIALELGYEITGRIPVNDSNTVTGAGYRLLDLRVAVPRFRLGPWSVLSFVGIENVLDERYVASVVPNAFGGRFFEPGPGRVFFAGLALGLDIGEP